MKPLHAANADRSERVAMIGQIERGEPCLLRPRHFALLPILKRDFQRHFDRRGTTVGKENVLQIVWRNFHQSGSKLDRFRVRRTAVGHMANAIDLLFERPIQLRVTVAMHVAPKTGDTIDVLAAIDVDQRTAVCLFKDDRFVLGHLGERMPDRLSIPPTQLLTGQIHTLGTFYCYSEEPRRRSFPGQDDVVSGADAEELIGTVADECQHEMPIGGEHCQVSHFGLVVVGIKQAVSSVALTRNPQTVVSGNPLKHALGNVSAQIARLRSLNHLTS